jgi:Asp-tRNA(Asn)/Glu-tRNA(Gln) amidotransferase C subunit
MTSNNTLEKLVLGEKVEVTDDFLQFLLIKLKGLKHLEIHDGSQLPAKPIFIKQIEKLEILKVLKWMEIDEETTKLLTETSGLKFYFTRTEKIDVMSQNSDSTSSSAPNISPMREDEETKSCERFEWSGEEI